eukprot:3653225-Alexandrium_andersonii.AAC.1
MAQLQVDAEQARLHLVGIQEGRWPKEAQFSTAAHIVIAGPRDAHNGAGCQLWISTCQPCVMGDRNRLLRPEHVQPLH